MNATKIIGTDEARGLAAKWKGYDGPYAVAPDDQGDYVIHHSEGADMAVARVEDFDEHSEPLARLFASAPDDVKALAATVIAQDADLARLRALVEQHEERARVHAEERAAHHGEMARVTGECARLRRTLALAQESLAAAVRDERVTVVDEIGRLHRERDAAHAVITGLRQEISDAADTLHRLSLAQQRIASAGDRGAWATSGAYARAAQIVAGIGDPAARAAIGGAS